MTRGVRRGWLLGIAALCAAVLVAALREGGDEGRASLRERPADWLLASGIADGALDSGSARRFELWHAAHAHAKLLAPHRQNTDAAFVRGGLFHWYELGAEDRGRVLKAAGPLMRDATFFDRMHKPLLQLTGDFAWVRSHAPPTVSAKEELRKLALTHGLFDEYRTLREQVHAARMQAFAARRRADDPAALLALLPERLDRQDAPLVRGLLEELERQAFDPAKIGGRVEEVVEFAVRHDLRPLTGVEPLLGPPSRMRDAIRARAAIELNQPAVATRIEMTSLAANDAEWQPYYLERARFEARTRRDAAAAHAYLQRAASNGMTVPVLAAAIDVARALGRRGDEQQYAARLAHAPRVWQRLCGVNEICTNALVHEWAAERRTQRITLTNVQSDQTPPYVEIYVDDSRQAEGEVRETRTFEIAIAPGVHEIEVRLVNARTRNGVQRRVRLS